MKKLVKLFTDRSLEILLVCMILFGVFLSALLCTITVREVFLRDSPVEERLTDYECNSDCIVKPDGWMECQCHPK